MFVRGDTTARDDEVAEAARVANPDEIDIDDDDDDDNDEGNYSSWWVALAPIGYRLKEYIYSLGLLIIVSLPGELGHLPPFFFLNGGSMCRPFWTSKCSIRI